MITMRDTDKIRSIIQTHIEVYNEIERRDVVFRFDFNSEKRRKIAPWIMMGRKKFRNEEDSIWLKLGEGDISKSQTLKSITQLMEKYYNSKYPFL